MNRRRLHHLRQATAFALGAVLLLAGPARAADNLNIAEQRFAPSPHPYDYFTVMSSHVGDTWGWNAGLMFNWSARTMVFEDGAGLSDKLLDGRLTADIMASLSLFRYVSLGIVFPLHMVNVVGDPNPDFAPNAGGPLDRGSIEGFSWGDLRISPKIRIFDALESQFGLAVAIDIVVPTGKKDALATEDGLMLLPRLIADLNIDGYRAALNFGYRWREGTTLRWLETRPEFYLAAAVGIPIIPENLEVLGELEMGTTFENFFQDGNNDFLEGRLGVRYITDFGLGVTVGAGGGMLQSYGSPLYRVFASLNYSPRSVDRDRDGDGVEDDVDQCPDDPEDRDGFRDEDGCPDPDNDGDGICDPWVARQDLESRYADLCKGSDACPDDAEDMDGFEDADGCPDADNDRDGLCDPWVERLGLADKYAGACRGSDRCPDDAEDNDGFEDADGCPDPDNDGDGICDPWVADQRLSAKYASVCRGSDACPSEPEDIDGCQDDDGCPEDGRVCVSKTEVMILEQVHFKTNRATIMPQSFPLLDEVAQTILAHPELLKLRVEGHTDNRGKPAYNLKLSKARAKAVYDYLVRKGVPRERLVHEGYGMTQPIETNDTEEGRAKNRRVQFTILERSDSE